MIKNILFDWSGTLVDNLTTTYTELYPAVKDVLKKLYDQGIKLAIMSSGSQEKIISDTKRYGLFDYFQEINGNILDKSEVITDILQRNNFQPEETIYIGDMPHDIEAGKKGGVVSIGISWGHKPKQVLEAANPDHLISDIAELEKLLD